MNEEKQIEKDELFGILSNTINGANFDDLSEAVYKISDVAGYRKQSEWISVEERLPEPNTTVLIYVFFHNQWQIVKGWHSYCDKKFHIANSDYPSLTDVPVTHWMPLPEAPKMKGGE